MDKSFIMKRFLRKLINLDIWGGRHTPIKNLFHLMDNASIKESRKVAKELANIGWIHIKISTGEEHISLNSHKSKEIRDFIVIEGFFYDGIKDAKAGKPNKLAISTK